MAEVYMDRSSAPSSNNSIVTAIAIIVLAILAALFFIYALPALRQPAPSGGVIKVDLQTPTTGSTQGTGTTGGNTQPY